MSSIRGVARRGPVRPERLFSLGGRAVLLMVMALGVWHAGVSVSAAAMHVSTTPQAAGQDRSREAGQPGHQTPEAKAGRSEHGEGESVLAWLGRLGNFAIMVGTLVYFLRAPLAKYLADRSTLIRSDLQKAAEMRRIAAAQLQEIERKLKALPGELESLTARGAQEVAAEDARIRQAAEKDRDRLLEQARREIDLRLRAARRELMEQASELAVAVASERLKTSITNDDQLRLADRYLEQVRAPRA